MSRHLTKKDIQIANMCIKRRSLLFFSRKMEIKTTLRYYLFLKKLPAPGVDEDVEQQECILVCFHRQLKGV